VIQKRPNVGFRKRYFSRKQKERGGVSNRGKGLKISKGNVSAATKKMEKPGIKGGKLEPKKEKQNGGI